MDGLIKGSIVPPEILYHPDFSFRCKNILMFCLCRTCVLTSSTSDECGHTENQKGALPVTWVMDEVWLAVEKGYWILEFYELYEYQVIIYKHETGEGIFVDYINTFLKLKT